MWSGYKTNRLFCEINKEGCVFSMVNSSELNMKQNRDDDHREDALHFIKEYQNVHGKRDDCNLQIEGFVND